MSSANRKFRIWMSTYERAISVKAASAQEALTYIKIKDGREPLKIVDASTDEKYVIKDGELAKDGKQCYACGMG